MANLRFINHQEPDKVTQEFQNLIKALQDKIQFLTEAPTSATQGNIAIQYTADNDATITLYVRHPNSGTWRSVNLT